MHDANIRKAKVVFLGLETFGRLGGIQRFNQRLLQALLQCVGRDNLHAHFTRDKPADIPAELSDVVVPFGNQKLSYILQSLKRALTADVLILGHVNLLWVGFVAKRMRPKLKVVMLAHGVEVWNDPTFRKSRFYDPYMLRKLDCIAAVSAYTAGVMQSEYALPESIFTIFPNTVDPIIDDAHAPIAPPFVLSVSRMDEHDRTKHLDQTIRAMARLSADLSHARLVIVGDGVLRPELEELASHEGVSDRVDFVGRVSDEKLLELYQAATLFALPSSKEGFGIVYLEAWTHLLPVICSVYGASSEVVSDGVDGFAVDPADTDLLADRFTTLLQDAALAQKFGRAGAKKLQEKYSTTVLNRNVFNLIKDVSV